MSCPGCAIFFQLLIFCGGTKRYESVKYVPGILVLHYTRIAVCDAYIKYR